MAFKTTTEAVRQLREECDALGLYTRVRKPDERGQPWDVFVLHPSGKQCYVWTSKDGYDVYSMQRARIDLFERPWDASKAVRDYLTAI